MCAFFFQNNKFEVYIWALEIVCGRIEETKKKVYGIIMKEKEVKIKEGNSGNVKKE